jgi:YidC/Oxa1 family membrane protein insertase
MEQTKNLIIAVVMATLVLFAWQYFHEQPALEAKKKSTQNGHTLPDTPQDVVSLSKESALVSREKAIDNSPRVKIHSDNLQGSISLVGARIDDIILPKYLVTTNPDSPPVTLLSPAKTKDAYFAEFGWLSSSQLDLPSSKTLWHADKDILTKNSKLTLHWVNNKGVRFIIEFFLDDQYMFSIKQIVNNKSGQTIALYNYGLVSRFEDVSEKFFISHQGAIGVFNNILQETNYDDLKKDKKQEFKNNISGSWFGISDKYWLTAVIPDFTKPYDSNFSYNTVDGHDRYQVDFITQKQVLAPGESDSYSTHFFAGAKVLTILEGYEKYFKLDLFDRAIDFGWFYFITKPMFKALEFFYKLLCNFGLSILLVTIIVKAVLFPLANKSFKSMNKMKQLQPQINRIRELHANDKMLQNKEIMELYKRERVNPLSGCLPLLVQIPIFFSLYKVLFVTIEMRHAPFYGWIHDLSAPDPTTIFNLFGLIPFTPPSFLMIGIWPIIMALTMYIQQLLNPQPADPVQAKMMKLLPAIFLFMFSSFPAGLVIYWAWSNTLSILQQWILQRQTKK